jgi:non-ribosomal peptide synthase protein (TIGR01720 family)
MTIKKNNIEDIYALSPLQEGLLFHYISNPTSNLYFEQLCLKIGSHIDIQKLEKAVDEVVTTNEMLRTLFKWKDIKKPVQIILKRYNAIIINKQIEKKNENYYINQYLVNDLNNGFDLEAPPYRITLINLDKQFSYLIISFHHILFDGWSLSIFLKELLSLLFNNNVQKYLRSKYKEYIKYIAKDSSKENSFWAEYLEGFNGANSIPLLNENANVLHGNKNTNLEFDTIFKNQIDKYLSVNRITLSSLIYGVWATLINLYNNTDDVLFGVTESGRNLKINGIENSIGLYIKTFPLRVKFNSVLMREIFNNIGNDIATFSQIPYFSLAEVKKFTSLDKAKNLFDTLVIVENYPIDKELGKNNMYNIESYSVTEETNYPITLIVKNTDSLLIEIKFDAQKINESDIETLRYEFKSILEQVVQQGCTDPKQLYLASNSLKDTYKLDFNHPILKYSDDKLILDLFEEQVQLKPDYNALSEGKRSLTYAELNLKSTFLAHEIIKKGTKPEDFIGVLMDRSIEFVISILAILKAGCCFIPIDRNTPNTWLQYIFDDSDLKFLLVDSEESLSDDLDLSDIILINVEQEISETEIENRLYSSNPENVAYIIYTSRIMGNPKRVKIEQKTITNYVKWASAKYLTEKIKGFPLFTSISLEITLTSIFLSLVNGKEIIIYPDNLKTFNLIDEIVNENKVEIIKLTSLHLKILKDSIKAKAEKSNIKKLIVSGENLPAMLVNEIHSLFDGEIDIYNEYGPTETAIGCMIHKCHQEENYEDSLNDNEKILHKAWTEVLKVPKISIDDNYYEIGGDSIKAIRITSILNKYFFDVDINLLQKYPTIKELSGKLQSIREKTKNSDEFSTSILSPAQSWFFSKNLLNENYFNQSILISPKKNLDENLFIEAFRLVVKHHKILNTKIQVGDSGLKYIEFDENQTSEIEIIKLSDNYTFEKEILNQINRLQNSINIYESLSPKALFFTSGQKQYISIVIHHLVVDGVSWRILIDDLHYVYNELVSEKEVKLENYGNSYFDWIDQLVQYSNSQAIVNDREYWKKILSVKTNSLPIDKKITLGDKKYGNCINAVSEIPRESLKKIIDKEFTLNVILIAAIILSLEDYIGNNKILVEMEGHGRQNIFSKKNILNKTIGWFTSIYPIVFELENTSSLLEKIYKIKDTMEEIPNYGISFGILRYFKPNNAEINFSQYNPEVSINYLGEFQNDINDFEIEYFSKKTGESIDKNNQRNYKLEINIFISNDLIYVNINYNEKEFKRKTIDDFLNTISANINKIEEILYSKKA